MSYVYRYIYERDAQREHPDSSLFERSFTVKRMRDETERDTNSSLWIRQLILFLQNLRNNELLSFNYNFRKDHKDPLSSLTQQSNEMHDPSLR